jgi:aminomethyltransferase
MPDYSPQARTPLQDWHNKRGVRFIDSDSWRLPAAYDHVEKEIASARAGAGLADLTGFAKVSVRGTEVAAIARILGKDESELLVRNVSSGMLGAEILACRPTTDHLLLFANGTETDPIRQLAAKWTAVHQVSISDESSALVGFALVGEGGDAVLRRLTTLDVAIRALPPGSCAETSLADVHVLLVRLPGRAQNRMQIYAAWDVGEYLWESLLEAGRKEGLVPIGLEAWRKLTDDHFA